MNTNRYELCAVVGNEVPAPQETISENISPEDLAHASKDAKRLELAGQISALALSRVLGAMRQPSPEARSNAPQISGSRMAAPKYPGSQSAR